MKTAKAEEKQERMTIQMSEDVPLSILPEEWPVIARVEHVVPDTHKSVRQLGVMQVLEHADKRRIVYGIIYENGRQRKTAGFLLERGGDTARALRRVAGIIGLQPYVAECLRSLPAKEL